MKNLEKAGFDFQLHVSKSTTVSGNTQFDSKFPIFTGLALATTFKY